MAAASLMKSNTRLLFSAGSAELSSWATGGSLLRLTLVDFLAFGAAAIASWNKKQGEILSLLVMSKISNASLAMELNILNIRPLMSEKERNMELHIALA